MEVPRELSADVLAGLEALEEQVGDAVQVAARTLVHHTISEQIEQQRAAGKISQGIALSVLNRRRRSARAWIVAILQGKVDLGTLHALTHAWIPQLAGTGSGR